MAEAERIYRCTSCGQVFELAADAEARCPNCGGAEIYQRDSEMLESERLSTETEGDHGVRERSDSAARTDVAADQDRTRFGQGKIA